MNSHNPWNRRQPVKLDMGTMILFLFIGLVVLKLAGVITWGWWIVTAPVWVTFLLFLFGACFGLLFALLPEIWAICRGKK